MTVFFSANFSSIITYSHKFLLTIQIRRYILIVKAFRMSVHILNRLHTIFGGRSMSKKISVICAICKKEFFVFPSKPTVSKFCSQECFRRRGEIMEKIQITCQICGEVFERTTEFLKNHPDTKFCSGKCYHQSRKIPVTTTCNWCNKIFETIPVRLRNRKHHFCCKECFLAWKTSTNTTINCEVCGKEITKIEGRPNKKYCSFECRVTAQTGRDMTEYVKCICKTCGKEFRKTKNHVDTKGGDFCSRRCWAESKITSTPQVCTWCGKEMMRRPSSLKDLKFGPHCSKECYYKTRRKITRENTSNFFWNRVRKGEGPNDCWLWMGNRNENNYGTLNIEGKNTLAHIFGYELQTGQKVPEGMMLLHSCDCPPCIRADHLTPNTVQANNLDKYIKNRMSKGENLPQSKLTPDDVLKIRKLASEDHSYKEIAEIFNNKVTIATITNIIKNKTWKHI